MDAPLSASTAGANSTPAPLSEPPDVRDTRASYDAFAVEYADLVRDELDDLPLGRALLSYFAELVRDSGGGEVLEVGCGPGRIAAHLATLGLDTWGVDLSPVMVDIARREHPGLLFETGSMAALDVPDASQAGVVAWYSIIHTPPARLPGVFAELCRVLAPGGLLLLAFQTGDEPRHVTDMVGHPVSLTFHRHQVDVVEALARGAGLEVVSHAWQERRDSDRTPQGFVLARRPPVRTGRG